MSNMEMDKLMAYINKNILADDNISEEEYASGSVKVPSATTHTTDEAGTTYGTVSMPDTGSPYVYIPGHIDYEDEEEYRKRKDDEDRINDVAYGAKKYMIEHDDIWWIPRNLAYKYNGHATSLGKMKTYCTCCGKTEVKEWLYNPRDIKEYLNEKQLTYNERVSIIKKKLIAFGGWEDDKTTEYFANYICRILSTPVK